MVSNHFHIEINLNDKKWGNSIMFLKNLETIYIFINDYWSLCYKTGKDSQKFFKICKQKQPSYSIFLSFLLKLNFKFTSVLLSQMGTALYTNLHVWYVMFTFTSAGLCIMKHWHCNEFSRNILLPMSLIYCILRIP